MFSQNQIKNAGNIMNNPVKIDRILVQSASRSWSGGPDKSMIQVDGKPAIWHTISLLREFFPSTEIRLVAPEFDKGGAFDLLCAEFANCRPSYSHDDSPIDRLILQSNDIENGFILRVDGLHFGLFRRHLDKIGMLLDLNTDLIKFPDDFPGQLAFEIWNTRALRNANSKLKQDKLPKAFSVHCKFIPMHYPNQFNVKYLDPGRIADSELQHLRKKMAVLYSNPRIEVGQKYIKHGDQIRFHYEKALDWIQVGGSVLDIACGNGFGSELIMTKAKTFYGGDLDSAIIEEARRLFGHIPNVSFGCQDITALSFPSESFECITSMETMEHINPALALKELHRVLKPKGKLIISTPQNSHGHIPLNAAHDREFSVEQMVALLKPLFNVIEVIGIKSGCITIPKDPKGHNMMIVAERLT
ncbi:class I SAM-dependent methyltransferase [bacterium]|nr:class I SAM-dependent methyltransferase [bacterium]